MTSLSTKYPDPLLQAPVHEPVDCQVYVQLTGQGLLLVQGSVLLVSFWADGQGLPPY